MVKEPCQIGEGGALAVAVRTVGVNGGGVLPPTLSNQLIETVAEILNLTGAEDAPHPHQMDVAPSATADGVATTSRPALPDEPLLQRAVTLVQKWVGQPRWGLFVQEDPPNDLAVSLGDVVVNGNREIRSSRCNDGERRLLELRGSG